MPNSNFGYFFLIFKKANSNSGYFFAFHKCLTLTLATFLITKNHLLKLLLLIFKFESPTLNSEFNFFLSPSFSLIKGYLLVSHLIASYVGASVIGHDIW